MQSTRGHSTPSGHSAPGLSATLISEHSALGLRAVMGPQSDARCRRTPRPQWSSTSRRQEPQWPPRRRLDRPRRPYLLSSAPPKASVGLSKDPENTRWRITMGVLRLRFRSAHSRARPRSPPSRYKKNKKESWVSLASLLQTSGLRLIVSVLNGLRLRKGWQATYKWSGPEVSRGRALQEERPRLCTPRIRRPRPRVLQAMLVTTSGHDSRALPQRVDSLEGL